MTGAVFIEPLDVLFLRGNKLFGDPGSYGESLVPPWPSVAAGALRSRMLADAGIDPAAFARGEQAHETIGTPERPGSFTVTAFHLARRRDDGRVDLLFAPPADIIISMGAAGPAVRLIRPTLLPACMATSAVLPQLPALAEPRRSKPATGFWLNEEGWTRYLAGDSPSPAHLVSSPELWVLDHRVGVGLDSETGCAADGRLFSTQAVALTPGVGFVAIVSGAQPPVTGTLRLGGDGRAAGVRGIAAVVPTTDYSALAEQGRCRLVLTTPGLFTAGWLPTGCTTIEGTNTVRFALHGVTGRISCAIVPRADVVSGWDMAGQQPKAAQRVAPAGSVYWLELDAGVTGDALRKLAATGLWSDSCEDPARRAEGFNRLTLAHY
jgi:CRISPR-associated protein Cmr3